MRRLPSLLALGAALAAIGSSGTGPARAAFPGANGRIVYERDSDIWAMNPDGTGQAAIEATIASNEQFPRVAILLAERARAA